MARDAVLVVPADIPLLAGEDIEKMVTLGRYQTSVVIAPDRHEEGTNLLLVRPPGLIPYRFGVNSFAEHQRLAQEADASLAVYRSERAGLDLDTPDDLRWYRALAQTLDEPVLDYDKPQEWLLADEPHLGAIIGWMRNNCFIWRNSYG